MSVANGLRLLAMPGPTNVPDEVLGAMHRPAVDIYEGELLAVTESCFGGLRTVFDTEHRVYIYASNGHGAWEAALSNVLSRGDRVLVLASGLFAAAWGGTGAQLGLEVDTLEGEWRRAVDPDRVEARLREDLQGRIKAVLVVQVDTASGAVNDIEAIRGAIDAAGHDALLMVDAIASLATMPFSMDRWGVDVAVSGSQKGLMTPPGLGFVAAGERALQAHAGADLRTHYWDWTFRDGEEHYMKYCGTPPEHLLFGLRRALEMLLEEGLEQVYTRHRLLAGATRAAVGAWAGAGALDFNITEPAERADSVTTVRLAEGHAAAPVIAACRDLCGITLGTGLGEPPGRAFRIAHMGHVNAPMILGTLASVEIALQVTSTPSAGGGVQAATTWLADALGGAGERAGLAVSG